MRNDNFLSASVGRNPVRPWPGVLSEGGSESFSDAGVSDCSKTVLVFSVVRGFAFISASACSALLSFSLSDSPQRRLRPALDVLVQLFHIHIHSLAFHRWRISPELGVQGQAQHLFHRPRLLQGRRAMSRARRRADHLPVGRTIPRPSKTRGVHEGFQPINRMRVDR